MQCGAGHHANLCGGGENICGLHARRLDGSRSQIAFARTADDVIPSRQASRSQRERKRKAHRPAKVTSTYGPAATAEVIDGLTATALIMGLNKFDVVCSGATHAVDARASSPNISAIARQSSERQGAGEIMEFVLNTAGKTEHCSDSALPVAHRMRWRRVEHLELFNRRVQAQSRFHSSRALTANSPLCRWRSRHSRWPGWKMQPLANERPQRPRSQQGPYKFDTKIFTEKAWCSKH